MREMHPLPLNLLAPRDLSRGTFGSWSAIETAPKNVPVLVFDGHAISVAERCLGRWYALVGDEPVWREDRSMAIVEPTPVNRMYPCPGLGGQTLESKYRQPTRPMIAAALARSISAYVSVVFGDACPKITRAASRPNSFRSDVALE